MAPNQSLHLTGAAIPVFRDITPYQRPRQVSLVVCAGHGTKRVGCKSRYQVYAEPKGKGVAVRWGLEEVQGKIAGR